MEEPAFAFHGDSELRPFLCVPPLRIVVPPGIHLALPPSFNPQNPFNGFRNDLSSPCMDSESNLKAARSKSFAVRDYPVGCGRNGGLKDADLGRSETQQGNAPAGEYEGSKSKVGKQTEASRPSSPSRDRKRTRKASSDMDTKRPKRPAGRPPQAEAAPNTSSARTSVTNTLRYYHAVWRHLLLEEEMKGKDSGKGSRPDLLAGSIINMKGLSVNRSGKVAGPVPGVEVGDQFYFRMEICCTGMHGPIQGGIEYFTTKESRWDILVATSIISAGEYDDRDDGEELIYTGQGGKSALDGKPNEDQKLERGNLAMEGSRKHQVPVRVIRGIKDAASPSGKVYTYDGLYSVDQCWSEKSQFGFQEFKFRLRRLPGQPELGSAVIKLSNSLKIRPAMRNGVRMVDLSNGKEALPIYVVNTVDDQARPAGFEYSTRLQYPDGSPQQFGDCEGCDCTGVCSASQKCSCFSLNDNVLTYLSSGVLVKERGLIYECGSSCKCSFSCRNRMTQRGRKFRLEVFKTEDRGWGLRSWDTIPAGSFVCEYTGKVLHSLHSLHTKEYVINLNRLPQNDPPWGDVSRILESEVSQAARGLPRPELIIDSSEIGNAARFINHSCSPNLLLQCVLQNHEHAKRPLAMLFAMDNIPPLRELTIDYGSHTSTSELKVCLCRL